VRPSERGTIDGLSLLKDLEDRLATKYEVHFGGYRHSAAPDFNSRKEASDWIVRRVQELGLACDVTGLDYHIVDASFVADDIVKEPPHYTRLQPEPIDVIAQWGLNFNRGSALKYIVRAGHKDPTKEAEDLRKAITYLELEIKRAEARTAT
jgi:hypothetical protein